jgi:glycerol-3-phosphate dehydrogenase
MSVSLSDYLIRRTGRLYFQRQELGNLYPILAEMMGELLDWDEAKILREMGKFKKEYDAVLDF